ncbi:unnamed protein product, partial [Musa banksii]
MTRRRRIWNERTSSIGSLWPLALDLLIALIEENQSYVAALKVKALPIGSFAPLCTLIDLVTMLDMN